MIKIAPRVLRREAAAKFLCNYFPNRNDDTATLFREIWEFHASKKGNGRGRAATRAATWAQLARWSPLVSEVLDITKLEDLKLGEYPGINDNRECALNGVSCRLTDHCNKAFSKSR